MKLTCRINIFFFLLLTISTFCYGAQGNSDSIKLGGAFALTGIAAPFGNAEANATRLAISEVNLNGGINGRKLELILEDTLSTQMGTVNAVNKLIAIDKVKLIIGPTWLDSFAGAIPIAERNKVVLITPSAVPAVMKKSSEQFPHVFSTFFNMEKELDFLLEHIRLKDKKRIVLLYDQDPFFQWIHASLKAKALAMGLEIVEDISIPIASTDLRTPLARIAKKQVEAVLFGFIDGGSLVNFLKNRNTFIPQVEIFGIHDIDGYAVDPAYQGLFTHTSYVVPASANQEFRSAYALQHKELPKLTASNAYDAVKIVSTIFEQDDFNWDSFPKLLHSSDFETVTFGKVRFDSLGAIDGGEFELKNIP